MRTTLHNLVSLLAASHLSRVRQVAVSMLHAAT
jgi:hypothetical protein